MSRGKLNDLMARYGLTDEDVAKLVHVSPSAVQSWRKPESSKSARPIPAMAMELLAIKLKGHKPAKKADK